MSKVFGRYGPRSKWLAPLIGKIAHCVYTYAAKKYFLFSCDSRAAKTISADFRGKLSQNKTMYILGIGASGHNSGVALIQISEEGIVLLSNHEEERFTGIKHCDDYPFQSIEVLKRQLKMLGLTMSDLHCIVASWDYVSLLSLMTRTAWEHYPKSFSLLRKRAEDNCHWRHIKSAFLTSKRLTKQLSLAYKLPVIGMPHHDNHAYFSYAVSPFNHIKKTVLVSVIDGTGDSGAISFYLSKNAQLKKIYCNNSIMDSLGILYGYLSATQGGWSFLSSEGRYMGAAAWGDQNRLTNPYYSRLRQICYFSSKGEIYINREYSHWHLSGQYRPYKKQLIDILGQPIKKEQMWEPDAILSVDDIQHSHITQERVDKAAALQLVFEDALIHMLSYQIKQTKADYLILSGGTALNCLANMKLLEYFDEAFYERYLDIKTRLHVWIPPVPGDAGTVVGAAYHFAMREGAVSKQVLETPFLCGLEESNETILNACKHDQSIVYERVSNLQDVNEQETISCFMANMITRNKVLGIFQGKAETGPRALGHRSILANPCDPSSRQILNSKVKFREEIRPLAPMLTLEAAKQFFELSKGASTNDYCAYDFMILTVRAKPLAIKRIPAVIHRDGTSRIQIVREKNNALMYSFLKAMGTECGVEVSINTSLNIGSPIVQTADQAIALLSKAKALDGLVMISDTQDVWLINSKKKHQTNPSLAEIYTTFKLKKYGLSGKLMS